MTGKDILAHIRDATATFAGLSALAYAAGYLALRVRARALGIESDFPLVDAVYVFSGFRFVLGVLFALLLLAPIYWIARTLHAFVGNRPRVAGVISGVAVLSLFVGVAAQFQILDVRDELLNPPPHGALADAALGANAWGVAVFFASVVAAAAGALWLYDRLRQDRWGGLTPALAMIVAMQLLFLPAVWGVFFGDRQCGFWTAAHLSFPDCVGPLASLTAATIGLCSSRLRQGQGPC